VSVHTDLIMAYGLLEQQVIGCMTALCREECSRCRKICCRIDYCRESLESVFLCRVRELFAPRTRWNRQAGWLSVRGCRLPAGRPPVCYEFLCDALEARQPSARHVDALRRLARVITEAGKGAGGKVHLVELDNLDRLNPQRLTARLDQARHTLFELRRFWQEGGSGLHHPLSCSGEAGGGGAPRVPSR
jgi:hypothetical protein